MAQQGGIRAVIFDLGGVIHDSPIAAIRRYCADNGVADVNPFLQTSASWHKFMQGKSSYGEFMEDVFTEAKAKGLEGIGPSFFDGMMKTITVAEARPLMLKALSRLRAAGLKTCALTNNWAVPIPEDPALRAEEERNTAAFQALFDGFIESVVVGFSKPDPRMYELALQTLKVEAHEAAFLDDLGQNLKPAKAMGIHTILVKNDAPTSYHAALKALQQATGVQLLDQEDLESAGTSRAKL
eukprot:TRINITY_DN61150_c0_g1_i1.p1 TRINITY_DN61150_c0_g1~~TRINITY_DN61150_c0_g1_i1.p1  ORF type:complete len:240 (-),score=37.15 TRINITY_DN61150_c0_g1_i1:139-858(-)